jgi:hypothetical protein
MNIHEHQAKELLAKYGVDVGQGFVAFTPEEAEKVAGEIKTPTIVVKAQIHAGGRGKGKFKEPEAGDKGGVRFAKSAAEAKTLAEQMLGRTSPSRPALRAAPYGGSTSRMPSTSRASSTSRRSSIAPAHALPSSSRPKAAWTSRRWRTIRPKRS